MPFDTIRMGASAAGAYEIDQSLRFNKDDSAYFNRTPSGDGSLTTWTWSGWVKKGQLRRSYNSHQTIFRACPDNGTLTSLYWRQGDSATATDADVLSFAYYGGSGSTDFHVTTNAQYRDVSGWYHIVAIWNTTTATANDRMQLWINGSRITVSELQWNVQPTQHLASHVNDASYVHTIGKSTHSPAQYLDGYLAEVHFVDGQVLNASNFGETNEDTGQWVPIKYAGSYGTNGFYLNFSDNSNTTAATLGKDSSGNGHNWTPNNFSVAAGVGNDSLEDSPTNNFCTLTPLKMYSTYNPEPTNGNLDFANSSANYQCFSSMALPPSGKWYAECKWTDLETGRAGIRHETQTGQWDGWQQLADGNIRENDTDRQTSLSSYSDNDIMGIAVNRDANTIQFYKNGTANGTTEDITATGYYYFIQMRNGSAGSAPTASWNFGQRPYANQPTGFLPVCTKNLPTPTILKGSDYFNSSGYTGNGSTQAVTGVGFQPDLVWIKNRSITSSHFVTDAVSGVNKELNSNNNNTQGANSNALTAFGTDGFSVGSDVGINNNSNTFVAWSWKESAPAGFDIVSWTGNGASSRNVSHSLGVAPDFMIVKGLDNNSSGGPCTLDKNDWFVYHKDRGNQGVLGLNENDTACTGQSIWNSTTPTSSVFSLGNLNSVNQTSNDYIAYLWASVEGFSAFGSYIGTGSQTAGPFVYTGFQPQYILVKKASDAAHWHIHDNFRNTYNPMNAPLYPNDTPADEYYNLTNAASLVVYMHSNGFQPFSTHNEYNASGATYIYAAFAERPFKYSNAR